MKILYMGTLWCAPIVQIKHDLFSSRKDVSFSHIADYSGPLLGQLSLNSAHSAAKVCIVCKVRQTLALQWKLLEQLS